jgi:DivIVA domain-containing protein
VAVLYFQLLAVVAVFAVIAWLATGRGGGIGENHPDRPDVALPDDHQLRKADIDSVRFTIGWRGYRMEEVDLVLDRLASEIDYRDRLIAELSPQTAVPVAAGVEYQPVRRPEAVVDSASDEAEVKAADVFDTTEPTETVDAASSEDNPLSSWYRKQE